MNKIDRDIANLPDTTASVRETFGFESSMVVPAYSTANE
ncbi:MAG: cobaltochelatase subunit CobS, partial [Rhizobiaceae bacterium]